MKALVWLAKKAHVGTVEIADRRVALRKAEESTKLAELEFLQRKVVEMSLESKANLEVCNWQFRV